MATAYIIWDRKEKAQVGGPGAIFAPSNDASDQIRVKIGKAGKHSDLDPKTYDVVQVTV